MQTFHATLVVRAFKPTVRGRLLERRKMLEKVYNEYKRSLKPVECRYLPNIATILMNFEFLWPLFTGPPSEPVTQQDFDDIAAKLGEAVSQWVETTKASLGETDFTLAKNIVSCNICDYKSCGSSLDLIMRHMNCPLCCFNTMAFWFKMNPNKGPYAYERKDVELDRHTEAEAVIRLCGRDPSTTTFDEMNGLRHIYECEDCSYIGTWDDAVSIAVTNISGSRLTASITGPTYILQRRCLCGLYTHFHYRP